MNTHAWQALTPAPDGLGESPFWLAQEQRLYWVDIPGQRVARMRLSGPLGLQAEAPEYWPLAEDPGCIAPVQGGGLLLALRSGLYRARTWQGPLERLAQAPYDPARLRFNDGKCDAQGRFWVGSLYEPKDQALAALYRLDAQGLQAVVGGATTANGLAFSPDGRSAYWADTAAHRILAFDMDPATGALSGERVFHQRPLKPAGWAWGSAAPYGGRPDGAAVDAEGAYWSAQYEGQCLLRLSPEGQVLAEVPTPVPCPTMPCLGGPDLRTLYLTTSRHGRSSEELARHPQAGCVWARRVDVPGLPVQAWQPTR